ncbi:sigma-54 dependent transcriptional regulator [Leeia sp. TBRC 13508]|uniref:Sigma-54 dependent transcriptional regulator n=1 Tax=Leeia speluncae TaxID=2884804 RepID=A0ABS8D5N0_9NEIS|nr:sigma-54 dependent transcriptional regulator [Leeia speluncae]MCB6183510.1 sigma-54 dependent transcriptional regulator [Leeia speluncae]
MTKNKTTYQALIIDDEPDLLELLDLTLLRMGVEVTKASTVAEALSALATKQFHLCLTDMRLPDGEGLQVVEHIQKKGLDVPIAVITAFGSADNAVAALKAGAFDYLSKPVSLEHLRTLIKSALNVDAVKTVSTSKTCSSNPVSTTLLGNSPAIAQAKQLIERVSKSLAPVYITGESGSGKERAARMIHCLSARSNQPFVAVNCGAIPENLMESEFFGYKKGAFTGATEDREGFFQAANGGTIFLDEVADLPLAMQVKLLRVIQEKKVRPLGMTQELPVDVRVISATHQNLANCVEEGRFRQDLFYRLNVISIRMPSLREMRDDVFSITETILHRLADGYPSGVPLLSASAKTALLKYDFPGNVRELENVLERALALCDGKQIEAEDLQLTPSQESIGEDNSSFFGDKWPLQDYLDRVEKEAILEALQKTRFNRTAAAKLLGITFRAMRYRMERLGLNEPENN